MSLKILRSYLSKEQPLTGTVLFSTIRQAVSQFWYIIQDLRSSGILRSVEEYFHVDVSGPPIDPILKGQDFFLTLEDGTNRLSGKIGVHENLIYIEAKPESTHLIHDYFHVSKGYYRQISVY
jgi:hypothetical protein